MVEGMGMRGKKTAKAKSHKLSAKLSSKLCSDEIVIAAETDLERKLLNTSGAIVVKFWDGKPHIAQDAFQMVAKKYNEDVKFACVRMKDEKLAKKFRIEHSPTFIFFSDGKEKSRINGVTPHDALDVWCEVNL